MKLSVSLSEEDVATIDAYARESGLPSRSAAVQQAVRLLRDRELEAQYEAAFVEWEGTEDQRLWESTVGDGLDDASW